MAKATRKGWRDVPKAKLAKRLGKQLELDFTLHVASGLTGESGDLAEVGHDAWVALEVESNGGSPTESVLRYWPWLDRNRRRLVLVHVVPPRVRKRRGQRAELTKWLGALMERVLPGRFTYCRVEPGTTDEADQVAAVVDAVAELREPRATRSPAAGL